MRKLSTPWLKRAKQFFVGLTATVTEADRREVREILPADAVLLFERMPVDGQRHSLNVLQTLRDAGHDHPDLLVAALLHDVGKVAADEAGIPFNVWRRSFLVALETISVKHLTTLASSEMAPHWRYLLHVHLEHPQIGAVWASEANCSKRAAWLIERHQEPNPADGNLEERELLRKLQWADGQN